MKRASQPGFVLPVLPAPYEKQALPLLTVLLRVSVPEEAVLSMLVDSVFINA